MAEVAVLLSGLLAGSLLMEGLVLVPIWQSLTRDRFYELHKTAGPLLFRYFAPLTSGTVIATASAAATSPTNSALIIAAVGQLTVLASFFLFFRTANRKLSAHAYDDARLAIALRHWALWHHLRTAFACVGFAAVSMA